MPFVSQVQRGLFYHKMQTGEMSPETVHHWEEATPKGKKLPYRKRKTEHEKRAFVEGLEKTAILGEHIKSVVSKLKKVKPETWDKAGLGALAIAPAANIYHAAKEKKPGEAAIGASELGGLGLLYHSVRKAHPA